MILKDVMKSPQVIRKDISLKRAARIMSSKGASSLLFVSDKKLKGIITERDLLRHYNSKKKISEVMTKKVVTLSSEDELNKALSLMRRHKIRRIPVLNGGRVKGIVTMTDIAANLDEIDAEFLFS